MRQQLTHLWENVAGRKLWINATWRGIETARNAEKRRANGIMYMFIRDYSRIIRGWIYVNVYLLPTMRSIDGPLLSARLHKREAQPWRTVDPPVVNESLFIGIGTQVSRAHARACVRACVRECVCALRASAPGWRWIYFLFSNTRARRIRYFHATGSLENIRIIASRIY